MIDEKKLVLKIGNKLYCIHYWNNNFLKPIREIETRSIKKINKKTIQLSYYSNYKIKINNINKNEWFTSEIEALEHSLKLHQEVVNKYKNIFKEINILKKMIKYRKKKIIKLKKLK